MQIDDENRIPFDILENILTRSWLGVQDWQNVA